VQHRQPGQGGDLEDQLAAHRVGELAPFGDRHHETSGSADDAIDVVEIEVVEAEAREAVVVLRHDRKAVDDQPHADGPVPRLGDRTALVVGTIARHVQHQPEALVLVRQDRGGAEVDGARNRGSAQAAAERRRQLRGHAGGVHGRRDGGPVDDHALAVGTGPFHVGDGDLAQVPLPDGAEHLGRDQGLGITLALKLELGRRHRARNVDEQRKLDIDLLGGSRKGEGECQEQE
jgi:hypothetical protein